MTRLILWLTLLLVTSCQNTLLSQNSTAEKSVINRKLITPNNMCWCPIKNLVINFKT
jgi:hypothetical protein